METNAVNMQNTNPEPPPDREYAGNAAHTQRLIGDTLTPACTKPKTCMSLKRQNMSVLIRRKMRRVLPALAPATTSSTVNPAVYCHYGYT